ncbi:MAG: DUF4402 domain-containing protein [Bacteroidota bacterium]|nr:DUF4402 domain-containing protein [Bacteroidota bacterium]
MIKGHLSILFLLVSFVAMNMAQAQGLYENTAKSKVFARVVTDYYAIKKEKLGFGNFDIQTVDGQSILKQGEHYSVSQNIQNGYKINYAANFYVSNNCNADFSVSLPNSPIALTNTSENKKLFVRNWKYSLLKPSGAVVTEDGFRKVFIDATVEVEPFLNKPGGHYTGLYIITFDFN